MRPGILLILLLAAAAHQATCQVTFATRAVAQLKELAARVTPAQAEDPPKFGGYFVTFAPGIGCVLATAKKVPKYDPVTFALTNETTLESGIFIAVSTRGEKGNIKGSSFTHDKGSSITHDGFTCSFKRSDYVISASQMQFYNASGLNKASFPKELYTLPSSFSAMKGQVYCSYSLYAPSGYNISIIPPFGCSGECPTTYYDIGNIQWHYDKPASVRTSSSQITVSCKVNRLLLNQWDTMFAQIPNEKCFPAWATVQTPSGVKTMAQLSVGDKVLAVHPTTGKAFYDDVYLVPHKDAEAATTYLTIHAAVVGGSRKRVLTLSPAHYVPTACGGEGKQQQQRLKYARDVSAGDMLWLVEGSEAVLARVEQVVPSTEQGLYSPWTLSGSIVVDGVAASTHTAWPGEQALLQLLPKVYVTPAQHLLAKAHQVVQAPLRMLYNAFGVKPLEILDNIIYSAMEAGKGGNMSAAAGAAAAAAAAALAKLAGAVSA